MPLLWPEEEKEANRPLLRQLKKKSGWRFLTLTSRKALRGTPSQRRTLFKDRHDSFQGSVRYYSKKVKKGFFDYLRVVEGGCYKQAHGHLLYRSPISRSKIQQIWKKHGAGYVTYDVPIEDEDYLLSVLWYMQSQRFFNPKKPDQYVPKWSCPDKVDSARLSRRDSRMRFLGLRVFS